MSYNENGTFAVGKTIYPLPSVLSSASFVETIDVPIYWLLQYFAAELETYAGAYWTVAMTAAGINTLPNIVAQKYPNNPFPYLQDTAVQFPLLAIYRVEGKFSEKTISFNSTSNNLEIVWVLPPLSMGQLEIVAPFKNAVLDIISNRSEYGWDPNFMDGYNWGQAAGFDYLQMVDYTYVNIPHTTTKLPMEAVVLKLHLVERNNPVSGEYLPISEIDTEIDLSDGYEVSDFINLNSNYNPQNYTGS